MAENAQTAKSKRDTFRESHAKRHPELNMDDEEAMYGSIAEDYGNYDNQIAELTESNNKYKKDQDDFIAAMASGEDNGAYIDGMMNGRDMWDTAIGIHGYDGLLEYLNNPETREKYKNAEERHKKQIEDNKAFKKEREANAAKTDEEISAAIEAGEFTEQDYNDAIDGLLDIADGISLNVVKPEWVKMWISAKNHDNDVDAAREEGRMDGLNQGIEKNIGRRKKNESEGQPQMPVGVGGKNAKENTRNGGSLSSLLFK